MERELNDQQQVRRQKMEELSKNGIYPFGNAFKRTERKTQKNGK